MAKTLNQLITDEQILNRSTRIMKRQGNMIPEKVNFHTTKDLINSEGNEIPISEFKMMIRTNKEIKEDISRHKPTNHGH
jgi:hypothetical protein